MKAIKKKLKNNHVLLKNQYSHIDRRLLDGFTVFSWFPSQAADIYIFLRFDLSASYIFLCTCKSRGHFFDGYANIEGLIGRFKSVVFII